VAEPQHRVEIVRQHTGLWDYRCSCGFVNQGFKTEREATRDADEHMTIMARGSDGNYGYGSNKE
jgi:hypothetical protein